MATMATKHSILRGLGILFVFMLVVFCGTFFYAYLSGGDSKVLSLFSGDGVGVLQVEGAIDDSRDPGAVKERYLVTALDETLAGKPVTTTSSQVSA